MDKLTIKNLDLYYSEFKALKNINLNIQEKEITAFIGPSGCGKSTLLKSLNRMNDLVEGCRIEGEVLLDGENIYKDMDVKMAVIFMNRKDNLVLRICKNFTNFLGNMICLKRCNIVFIIRIKGKNL